MIKHKKPGPKTGTFGKKRTYSFTLSQDAYRKLATLAIMHGSSASGWLEQKVLEEPLDTILDEIKKLFSQCKSFNLSREERELIEHHEEMLKPFEQFSKEPWVFERAANLKERAVAIFKELQKTHDLRYHITL